MVVLNKIRGFFQSLLQMFKSAATYFLDFGHFEKYCYGDNRESNYK